MSGPTEPDNPAQRLDARLAPGLAQREAEGLRRQTRTFQRRSATRVQWQGRECINFCANDYLGLAADPRVVAAGEQALQAHGAGSGAAHLITGHSPEHAALEAELAEWTGREAALLFSTGYMANLGLAQALAGKGDSLVQDKLNHASLIDGGQLSRARLIRYHHADAEHLDQRLATAPGHRLVMTDSVFSMDGDIAPLKQIANHCQAHQATLMVDEAHGLGVLGPEGRGAAAEAGLGPAQVPVFMGTLGKALGGFGAFVAGSRTLIDYLQQYARAYVYTTATPPSVAAMVRAGVAICREDTGPRDQLAARIAQFREGAEAHGIPLMPSRTPIQPIRVGEAAPTVALSRALAEAGFLVQAIRPPTVPAGTARLRVTLSAAHSEADVEALVAALATLWK
ncbi:8-amino-7-oxononanoate synthase [Natronospira proteinivora]|uniref:8-amino-7-oxononanoate synthase n=1 Tax=Natronospira proteinivora TaxID=1807133 RepID=A0ABT1GCF6_9GAMM|nr:8-amino-7-oxononanoate synthase [Natronospira proteinivora]MCP1727958.1 8-amino-7-oxononanoate synthase [Natronospira proteinivora]